MKKKPSSPVTTPPQALHRLPRKALIPAFIGIVTLVIALPWLLDFGNPAPPTSAIKNSGSSKSKSQSASTSTNPAAHTQSPYLPPPDFGAPKKALPPSDFLSLKPPAPTAEEAAADAKAAATEPTEPTFQHPLTAPNGSPWPEDSDYVDGYDQEATGGLSTVTVDNSRNPNDVFLKLVALQGNNFQPVRVCYIKAFGQFVFSEIQPGNYDVRFQNLTTGEINASAPFTLQETPTANGNRYSNYTLTLYNVANGNMRLRPLKDNQF